MSVQFNLPDSDKLNSKLDKINNNNNNKKNNNNEESKSTKKKHYKGSISTGNLKTRSLFKSWIAQECSYFTTTKTTVNYKFIKIIGRGAFSVVYKAKLINNDNDNNNDNELNTSENNDSNNNIEQFDNSFTTVIKRTLLINRTKEKQYRELAIMETLKKENHPNIIQIKDHFESELDDNIKLESNVLTDKPEECCYLNLVMEYIPSTLYHVRRHYKRANTFIPMIYVKLYCYQLFAGLAHLHELGICHRDIKPRNVLVDPVTCVLKICDFGSSKLLEKEERHCSYICSRYYRAPELLFGSFSYTFAVDIWAAGCTLAELFLLQPVFRGKSTLDQIVEIIKILGTPSKKEIHKMNPNYKGTDFPKIKSKNWSKVLPRDIPDDAFDLLNKIFTYDPNIRITAVEACNHPFFDEIKNPNIRLPNNKPLCELWIPGNNNNNNNLDESSNEQMMIDQDLNNNNDDDNNISSMIIDS